MRRDTLRPIASYRPAGPSLRCAAYSRYRAFPFRADASLFGGGSPHALTKRHIDMMGASGLRTLVMAAREVDEREYAAWEQEYRQAQVPTRGQSNRAATIAAMGLKGCPPIRHERQTRQGCRAPETGRVFVVGCGSSREYPRRTTRSRSCRPSSSRA